MPQGMSAMVWNGLRSLGERTKQVWKELAQPQVKNRVNQARSVAAQKILPNHDTDSMTGLALHSRLVSELGELAEANWNDGTLAMVIYIDLDNFKSLNDTHHHKAGNELLVMLGEKIRQGLGPNDQAYRPHRGGDEFIIVRNGVSDRQQALIEAMQICQSLQRPYELPSGITWDLELSAGVTLCRESLAQLREMVDQETNHHMIWVDQADEALRWAKDDTEMPTPRVVLFSQPKHDELKRRENWLRELKLNGAADTFHLTYQPIIHLCSKAIVAAEVLPRPQGSWVPQSGLESDIAELERLGKIGVLSKPVIEAACRQLRAWQDRGLEMPAIHINLSPQQLCDKNDDFADFVLDCTDRHGINPSRITFEVTERQPLPDDIGVRLQLDRLRDAGFGLSMDDYGTGFATAAQLANFPTFTNLKLDQSLVRQVAKNERVRVIVKHTIDLAKDLGLTVTAEGIELQEQAETLQGMGCTYGQGYFYSMQMSARNLETMVQSSDGLLPDHRKP